MSKKGLDLNHKTEVKYGPATGISDPGLQPVTAEHPYEGDRGPGGKSKPGHAPGGPGHKDCDHE